MGRLKIISDGTTKGTIVIDEETGKEIVNLQRIKLSFDKGDDKIFLSIFASDVPFEIIQDKETTLQAILPASKVVTADEAGNAIDITQVE